MRGYCSPSFALYHRKVLRAESQCGGKVKCRQSDPPQAENSAKLDSYSYVQARAQSAASRTWKFAAKAAHGLPGEWGRLSPAGFCLQMVLYMSESTEGNSFDYVGK